ncbi:MAG: polysaccharide pyruvyl transferase family protein [Saprospiraceae bacterium]|nr:polysaccharide pyruvyl transferase family protein [Saprospiraceae bacterium]
MMYRRDFLKNTGGSLALFPFLHQLAQIAGKENPNILLVSGWQDINIGDIAHTPGLLHILETFMPDASIVLWKKSKGEEVRQLLNEAFPKVEIFYEKKEDNKILVNEILQEKIKWADVMIHGSGPSVVGRDNLQLWSEYTDKPFGIFGTTIQQVDEELRQLLGKAAFIYTRETASLEVLEKEGLSGDHIAFAPDATFFLNLHDRQRANAFLQEHQLQEGKYICVIPRLRFTPYHKLKKVNWSDEKIEMVERVNAETKEKDHAKLREAMIAWVRQTGNKVLVCPEMTYQVDIMDELLIEPLPEDVKAQVIKRGYWMPGEAASVYQSAFAVMSSECHSPIIALTNGTPAFYIRQPTDTIKGQMYYDLDLSDWVFEIDDVSGNDIATALMDIYHDYSRAKDNVASVNDSIEKLYNERIQLIHDLIK